MVFSSLPGVGWLVLARNTWWGVHVWPCIYIGVGGRVGNDVVAEGGAEPKVRSGARPAASPDVGEMDWRRVRRLLVRARVSGSRFWINSE